jgi:hypothetical protein
MVYNNKTSYKKTVRKIGFKTLFLTDFCIINNFKLMYERDSDKREAET